MFTSNPVTVFSGAPPPIDPWIQLDGRLNAPIGSIQFPNILNGYPVASPPGHRTPWPLNGTQPPWKVAGVDYYVGIPSGTTLLDWQLISISGVTVNTGTNTVTVGANNVTLDSIDFSLHGGCQLAISSGSAANCTVSKCKFILGAAQPGPPTFLINCENNSGLTVTLCMIDGTGPGSGVTTNLSALIGEIGPNVTITYNELRKTEIQFLGWFAASGGANIKYNLMWGAGDVGTAANHVEYLGFSDSGNLIGVNINFNTTYQDGEPTGTGHGFDVFEATHTITGEVGNNTMIYSPTSGTGQLRLNVAGNTTPVINCHDNYIDIAGAAAYISTDNTGSSTYTSNISLRDGHVTTPPNFT